MVNDQKYYLDIISENNRTRVCIKCFEINKINKINCYNCQCKLIKFPNQLSPEYSIGFSKSNNGAIYFYNIDKQESYWYPL